MKISSDIMGDSGAQNNEEERTCDHFRLVRDLIRSCAHSGDSTITSGRVHSALLSGCAPRHAEPKSYGSQHER